MGGGTIQLLFLLLHIILKISFAITIFNILKTIRRHDKTTNPNIAWLILVPFIDSLWNFYIVNKISKSISQVYIDLGKEQPEFKPTFGFGIIMSICIFLFTLLIIIPKVAPVAIFQSLLSLVGLLFWILYWIKVSKYNKKLKRLLSQ